MNIDIIGGGIGGLTTAIALQQKGIKSTVHEQAKTLRPVGAGIILANNAMQIYDKLGLRSKIEAKGNPISFMNVTDAQLQTISKVDLTYFEHKFKVQSIAIHRGVLQQILIDELAPDCLKLDRQLTSIKQTNNGFNLEFQNGEAKQVDTVLGADGIHSKVRKHLFTKDNIRNAHQVCWRGVTNYHLPKKYHHQVTESWGKGDRFGFTQIAPNRVYWFGLKSFKQNPNEFPLENIQEYFGGFDTLIQDIVRQTPLSDIHTDIITDLQPIKTWYKDNVCLIGDAAHATTPNMGQGACQSIEDAYILAELLSQHPINKAFAIYQRSRISKAHRIVNMSWTLGKVAHWKNPFAILLRNQLLKMTPESINRKQSEKIFTLELP